MNIKFKTAPYEACDIFWTIMIFLLGIFFVYLFLLTIMSGLSIPSLIVAGVFLGFSLLLFKVIFWAPLYYSISDKYVSIHRLAGAVDIPIAKIRKCMKVDKAPIEAPEGLVSRFFNKAGGVNGMGFFGTYKLIVNGLVTEETAEVYCTGRSPAIIFRTNTEVYIISAADPDNFLLEVKKRDLGNKIQISSVKGH